MLKDKIFYDNRKKYIDKIKILTYNRKYKQENGGIYHENDFNAPYGENFKMGFGLCFWLWTYIYTNMSLGFAHTCV
jgi:hypothetical protein